jgi:hypothetical protein
MQESDAGGMKAGNGDKTWELRLSPIRAASLRLKVQLAIEEVVRTQKIEDNFWKRAGSPRKSSRNDR